MPNILMPAFVFARCSRGNELAQELHPFCYDCGGKKGDARHVATRPVDNFDEFVFDRVSLCPKSRVKKRNESVLVALSQYH